METLRATTFPERRIDETEDFDSYVSCCYAGWKRHIRIDICNLVEDDEVQTHDQVKRPDDPSSSWTMISLLKKRSAACFHTYTAKARRRIYCSSECARMLGTHVQEWTHIERIRKYLEISTKLDTEHSIWGTLHDFSSQCSRGKERPLIKHNNVSLIGILLARGA